MHWLKREPVQIQYSGVYIDGNRVLRRNKLKSSDSNFDKINSCACVISIFRWYKWFGCVCFYLKIKRMYTNWNVCTCTQRSTASPIQYDIHNGFFASSFFSFVFRLALMWPIKSYMIYSYVLEWMRVWRARACVCCTLWWRWSECDIYGKMKKKSNSHCKPEMWCDGRQQCNFIGRQKKK